MMRRLLAALGTAALIAVAAPAHAAPVSIGVQSLTDHEVAYAKKGGWHGGGKGWKHGWKHGRGWGQRGAIGVSTATATAGNACRIVPARTRAGGLLCPVHKS